MYLKIGELSSSSPAPSPGTALELSAFVPLSGVTLEFFTIKRLGREDEPTHTGRITLLLFISGSFIISRRRWKMADRVTDSIATLSQCDRVFSFFSSDSDEGVLS